MLKSSVWIRGFLCGGGDFPAAIRLTPEFDLDKVGASVQCPDLQFASGSERRRRQLVQQSSPKREAPHGQRKEELDTAASHPYVIVERFKTTIINILLALLLAVFLLDVQAAAGICSTHIRERRCCDDSDSSGFGGLGARPRWGR